MTLFDMSSSELTALAILLGVNICKYYDTEELEVFVSLLELLIGILDLNIVCNEKDLEGHSDFTAKI